MSRALNAAVRPDPDEVITRIADYVCDYEIDSAEVLETARYCLTPSAAACRR